MTTSFKVFSGVFSGTLLAQILTAGAGLVTGILLARTLGPHGRGELAAIILWPGILFLFGELGLGFAFSYFTSKKPDAIPGLFTLAISSSIVTGGGLALAGFFILPTLLPLSSEALSCLKLCLLSVPFQLGVYHLGYLLLGSNRIGRFNLVRLYTTLTYTCGIVGVVLFQAVSLKAFTLVYLFSQVSAFLLALIVVMRSLRPRWSWQSELIGPVFRYGIKTYAGSLASQANLRLDQTLMTVMVSANQLGLYVVAVAVAGLLAPIHSALAVVVLPRVTREPSPADAGRTTMEFIQLAFLLAAPPAILALLLMPWLLPLVFGPGFQPAVRLAQILLVSALFQGANIILGNALRGLGRPGITSLADTAGLVITLALLVSLLPKFGALGAALASLAAYGTVMAVQLKLVLRVSNLPARLLLNPRIILGRFRRQAPSP